MFRMFEKHALLANYLSYFWRGHNGLPSFALHKGTISDRMTHQPLSSELKRIAELVQKHENSTWSALDRDHVLAEIRTVYARLLEVPLGMAPRSEQPLNAAAPVPVATVEPEAEPATLSLVQPEVSPVAQPIAPTATPRAPEGGVVPAAEATPVSQQVAKPKVEEQPIVQPKPEPKVEARPVAQSTTTAVKADVQPAPILADKLQKPIADLRTGIPLNEKFGLIKTLFDNNSTEYQDAILHLGRCANRAELFYHFDEIARQRQWNLEDSLYLQLREYIERRAVYLDLTTAAS